MGVGRDVLASYPHVGVGRSVLASYLCEGGCRKECVSLVPIRVGGCREKCVSLVPTCRLVSGGEMC